MRTAKTWLLCGAVLSASFLPAWGRGDGAPGDVAWWQKIGDALGGFGGTLDDGDSFGFAVTRLGDLDGDGITDLAVGAHLDDDGGDRRGAVWILFLDQNGAVKGQQKISDYDGGFTGTLDNIDWFGCGLASLPDFNGDGIRDLAVGAALDDDGGGNKGAFWILFLDADGTVKGHQKISATTGGFGGPAAANGWFGLALADIGDLDGDGVIDLAVGAPYHDNDGAVWILFMNANATVKGYAFIDTLAAGLGQFGWSVAGLGDLDGDGIPDLAVGARRYCDGGGYPCNAGAAFVVFLNSDGSVKASQKIGPASGGFAGELESYDFFGSSLCAAGDLDGDGIVDLAVGAPQDDDGGPDSSADIGAVWLLFLATNGTVKDLNKISLTSGGFDGVLAPGDRFGTSLGALGDFDGDGVPDLACGASNDAGQGFGRGALWLTMLENPIVIDLEQAPAAEVGVEYAADLALDGGTPPYTVTVVKGSLPPGIELDDDGQLSGTPTRKGSFDFQIEVADDPGQTQRAKFRIVVKKPVRLDTPSLDKARHGEPYSERLAASGGAKPYAFSVVTESLPDGLELDESTGRLTGTPTQAGDFPLAIRVEDALGGWYEAAYLLKVKRTLKVATKSLPKGKVGRPYDEKIAGKGGYGAYQFEIAGGALPDGLQLEEDEANSGFVRAAGLPEAKGVFQFTVRITDSGGEQATRSLVIKIK